MPKKFIFLFCDEFRSSYEVNTERRCPLCCKNLKCPLWWDYLCAWLGTRHMVTMMLSLLMANAYIMRTNMSVAIVAMVNHTALPRDPHRDECGSTIYNGTSADTRQEGTYVWDTRLQSFILSSFFYGYVITQVPFGILSKRYGAKYFLGVGMLINSVFGVLVPLAAKHGPIWLSIVRFIQGLGEGPIVPCTTDMLAKWVPQNERSRMGAFVFSGAQIGTVVSMSASGYLAEQEFAGGWPSIFYVFGVIGIACSLLFLFIIDEDPRSSKKINRKEQKYIVRSVWGSSGSYSPAIPWKSFVKSLPVWAILTAHVGQNFGYETLMMELPTYMKQVLHFTIKENGHMSSLPYLAMWIISIVISFAADYFIQKGNSPSIVRKIANSIGQFGPAIALIAASFTGCHPYVTVTILTIGVGLNGGIYSGFKVNHMDISPRFAGILMSFTNCLANVAGLLAPPTAGYIVHRRPNQTAWREVFFISAAVYIFCASVYLVLGTAKQQIWNNPNAEVERPAANTDIQQETTNSDSVETEEEN